MLKKNRKFKNCLKLTYQATEINNSVNHMQDKFKEKHTQSKHGKTLSKPRIKGKILKGQKQTLWFTDNYLMYVCLYGVYVCKNRNIFVLSSKKVFQLKLQLIEISPSTCTG